MPIFSTAKESLTIVGILPVAEHKIPVKLRKYKTAISYVHVFFVLSWIMCYLFAAIHFMLFQANAFSEYFGNGLYCILNVLRIIVYIILLLNITKMSNLWNEVETIIEKGKFELDTLRFFFRNY